MKYGLELKVGLLVIFSLFSTLLIIVFLKNNPFSTTKQHFSFYIHDASGVGERTQVLISGVQVGVVNDVNILPTGAVIQFELNTSIKLPKDSYVEVRSRGLLGDVYIEFVRGKNPTELLKSGDIILLGQDSGGIQALMAQMSSIAADVKKVTAVLSNSLGTKNSEMSIESILKNVDAFTADLKNISKTETKNIKELIATLNNTAGSLNHLISDNKNADNIGLIIKNLKDTTDTINRLVAKIERGEGTIGQLVSKDDTINEVKSTLKSVQDVIKPATRIKLSLAERAEYRFANAAKKDSFANDFNLLMTTRPDRYYLLGVSTATYGRKVTDTTTTTSGATATTIVNTTEDSGLLRYNVQISQRFHFIALRLGIFSSSMGIATDLFTFKDSLRGTVELSQFNGSPTPSDDFYGSKGPFNLKSYVNFYPIPQIFLTAGVDGVVLFNKPFPFVGAGFSFSDEDINGILGLAAAVSSAK